MSDGQVNAIRFGQNIMTDVLSPTKSHNNYVLEDPNLGSIMNKGDLNKSEADQQNPNLTEKERERLKERANKIFEALNTGLAFKFHEKSGKWYAVIENKITQEVLKEIPPKFMLELEASLKEMIGVFLDKKL
ncbi:flagellar protein FlaG [Aneurinibacillus terranovensis]|uniref:flagellar protein FlaG n=1 Tax=Aneurinibacillus terranovensis TaxID=278991 RepID=UPI0004127346|nr:flagellar protein FlaG [Aneurinibacillus terranovensis]